MNISLPTLVVTILSPFAQLFSKPVWKKAQFLCVGAILCQGARQISKILTIMGMADHKRFEAYHRFLNRDQWNQLLGAKILLGLLASLVPTHQSLIIAVDETIERRRGKNIKAKGCYRDAVRSTQSHVITCFGLKWLSFCLIIKFPWARRPWALPFLTMLQYSKDYHEKRGRSHHTTLYYVKMATRLLRRWLRKRSWIVLGDGGFASVEMAQSCLDNGGHLISRLRIDARLYAYPQPRPQGMRGRKPTKGKRIYPFKAMLEDPSLIWQQADVLWYGGERKTINYLSGCDLMYKAGHKTVPIRWVLVKDPEGKLLSIPLFSTNVNHKPEFIIETFVRRFSIEILFEESRAHLGIETQRQWSDKAIVRTTPLLFGLFSIICLIALKLRETVAFSVQSSAWYTKNIDDATFSDIIAYVRRYCWAERYFVNSPEKSDLIKFKSTDIAFLLERISSSP
jgi:hypothetical protein